MTSDQAAFIRKRIRARDNFLIVGGTGSGKALPLDAQILTPAGYVAMRDLRIGDRVIGRNGRATRITGVFPQGKKSAWRLTFSDGCTTIACDEHLWAVQTKSGRSAGRDFVVKSVKEIRTDLTYSDGKPKWFIPMVEPIHLKKRAVGLDPYVLGFLLGRRRLTGSVPIRKEGEAALLPTSDQPLSYAAALRKLGLLNQDLSTVCIPDTYKWNDLATRLALFQGLMDGGAWFQAGNNHISFSCASRDLAEDVIWLVQSFGGVARLNERDGRMYRIYIRLPESIVPSRAPWTLERYRPCTYRPPARSIVSIERVKPVPMQCIAVDAPDALYVIEHCVVTHNTTLGNAILKEMSEAASADERFIILEDTAELQCFAPQTVMLLTSPQMTMNDLLKAIMRHSPTRICVGELRGGEAHTLIKAWNTGHNGGLTTIHAENAHRALDRLEDLVLEAGIQPSRRKIADSVNCIIVINADSRGHRTVKEIVRVSAVGNDYILSTK